MVINNAVTSNATATRFAPQRLKPLRRPPDRSSPSAPPARIAPRTSQICHKERIAGSESSSNANPMSVATCDSTARLRNQRHPRTKNAAGSRKAANPKTWKRPSAQYAPTGPIQFWVTALSGAETLNAASFGKYVSNASAISTASVIHKNPISSLKRLFPVGVRMRTKSPQLFGEG